MMRKFLHHSHSLNPPRQTRGFTLIEVLIVVGIISLIVGLALPAILLSRKRGMETRIRSDLNLIANGINAYKDEFGGQYPQFATIQDDLNSSMSQTGTGLWLDECNVRGAVLLCRAMIGPGPAGTNAATGFPANPGDDGADGPGFRVRRITAGTNADGTPKLGGKVYGPYLDASKFKIAYVIPGDVGPGVGAGNAKTVYPVICDIMGNPILYYPATPGNPVQTPGQSPTLLGYANPQMSNANTPNAAFRFNGFDNSAYGVSYPTDGTIWLVASTVPQAGSGQFDPNSPFAKLAANCGSPEYLLWSAGLDGQFGFATGQSKSDDITYPFDLPPNLKK